MRNIIIPVTCILILASFSLQAQFKVTESSGKKPDWTGGLEKNYIIGIGNGPGIDVARDKAMLDVKNQIVTSVADYISSSTDFYTKEISANKFSELYQSYTNEIKSQSGKRDYLQGISASRIEEFYWEKLYDKKAKETKYEYFVKYPFSQFDLDDLVNDFKEKDRMLTEEMQDALDKLETFTSIEEIQESQSILSKLVEIFIDERQSKCLTGIEKCKSLLASVYIADAGSELGIVRYSLKIGSKAITFARKPVVNSNCARILNKTQGELVCEIVYDYAECYEDPENHIKVVYSFSSQKPEKSFYFDVAGEKAEISITGNFRIDGNADGEKVSGAVCVIPLKSKYDSPVAITQVILEWKDLGVMADVSVKEVYEGKGQYELRFVIPKELPAEKISTASNPGRTIDGYLFYKSIKTGKSDKIRIYRHDYTTSW
ncbi:MAG: hypothetical protein KKA81_07450 [Bacteroidetes bacterium]|nr:hypothetical protein [Bacteroidota bacterium]